MQANLPVNQSYRKPSPSLRIPPYHLKDVHGRSILNSPELFLEEGKTHALIGPSGSGKSLFLRSLFGWTAPGMEAVLSPSGDHFFLLQDPGQGLTEGLTIGGHFRELGLGRNWQRLVEPLLDTLRLDLPQLFKRKPGSFSGGERQRLMLAMVLVRNPRWLVCDEPAASLDEATQNAMWEWLFQQKSKTGMTLVFATHRIEMVRGDIDRVLHFAEGQIVEPQPSNTQKVEFILPKPKGKTIPKEPLTLEAGSGKIQWQGDPLLRWEHFSLTAGQTIWLSGVSGSGKTTFGRMLAGLDPQHPVSLRLDGQPLANCFSSRTPRQRQAIGYLFQHGTQSLNPMRTVGEQLSQAYENDPDTLAPVLATLRLDHLDLNATPDHFSLGEYQRLNLARILGHRRHVLIADELLAPLDRESQKAVLSLIAAFQKAWQMGVLILGHDLSQQDALPGRHLTIGQGRLIECET